MELHVTVGRNEACGQGEGRNSSGGRMSVVVLRNDAYGRGEDEWKDSGDGEE